MKDVLGAVVRKLVEIPDDKLGIVYDLLEKQGKLFEDGEWGDEFKKFLRKEKCWVNTLLEFIGTIKIPATTKKVVVCDYVQKIRKTRKLYAGSNFEEWFFSKTVEPISQSVLNYHKLRKSSVDSPIIAELGGEVKTETTLAEMFALMEMQANGEDGALLTNGYANIFYIRDINGVLRAVLCFWGGVSWRVDARSVGSPGGWGGGRQIFSRNSLES